MGISWILGANQQGSNFDMGTLKQLALLAIFCSSVFAIDNVMPKKKKAIGIFNVVKFPNDVCDSNTAGMNGTCYTAEECSSRDGVASGECADGYGVCCVITLACGSTSTENGTYLSQAASTDPATDSTTSQSCGYTICPKTTAVSRIRLDLTTFVIDDPFTAGETGAAATGLTASHAVGKCDGDSFSVTGAPVICGVNSGQHMIVDTDGSKCVTAAFSYGAASFSRSYTIKVTQFESTNEMGGPTGCLQFYTGLTGTVSSFNWDAVGTSTHLANQHYDVCVRPAVDRCHICWAPITTGNAITIRGSFGVSNSGSAAAAGKAGVGAACPVAAAALASDSDDFILIPNGQAAASVTGAIAVGVDKYCGRFLNPANDATADVTVCSRVKPFSLTVNFDDFEAQQAAGAGAINANEASGTAGSLDPLGTQGFSLGFRK